MSYNDVQQLKMQILNRLGAQNFQMGSQASPGYPNPNMGRFATANNRAMQQQQSMQPQQPQMPSRQMHNEQRTSQQIPRQMHNEKKTSQHLPAGQTNAKPKAGAYFKNYDCGHKYPTMTVRQHLKNEMKKDRSERIDNLKYAFAMAEILGEPVCKRRRRYN